VLHLVQKYVVEAAMTPSLKRCKGSCVSGWKMRHKELTVNNVVMLKAVELYNHYAESGGD